MTLSDTQHAILTAAAQHPDHLALPPDRLPAGARQKVARALLRADLVIAFRGSDYDRTPATLWTVDGDSVLLKITDEGLRAIGIDPNAGPAPEEDEQSPAAIARRNAERLAAAQDAPTAPTGAEAAAPEGGDAPAPEPAQATPLAPYEAEPEAEDDDRPRHEKLGVDEAFIYGPAEEWQQPAEDAALLEQALAERAPRKVVTAAQAVLTAWDASPAQDATNNPISRAIEGLRAALASKPARAQRDPAAPRKPREGTKQEQVLAMLRRPEGATVAQIAEATGWAAHTVRGFFAGLKKRQGIEVQVLERVRMVGPNKDGAKGSYSIYHLPA
ncbi:DUF3489 domain-containing protein [Falsiroseomonas ponticola]|uniref:DUF3489 domain-containing protein n=1 Tax=Falsiroseomonas ponticola TaxID=2786951 RepID=UPI001932FE85|nr:DUF3489 domain-containing protein [Roseomonas ponticola]